MEPLDLVNFAALILLGAGFFWRGRKAHVLRSTGWLMLGLYWLTRAPGYLAEDDLFNALGAAMALPVFGFLAYHEFFSYNWHDEYPPLRFVTGAMFIAGMGYFLLDNIPALSRALIETVARQSVWLANLGGYDFGVGLTDEYGTHLTQSGLPFSIIIVLECTAVQAYFVAGSFLFGCRGSPKKRGLVFAIMLPVIWFVNLARNAMVIVLVHKNGPEYFDFAHNILGKGLSLVALILLILVAFIQVPELYEDINGLFELPWRRGPKHDYMRFVGRLYRDKTGKE